MLIQKVSDIKSDNKKNVAKNLSGNFFPFSNQTKRVLYKARRFKLHHRYLLFFYNITVRKINSYSVLISFRIYYIFRIFIGKYYESSSTSPSKVDI